MLVHLEYVSLANRRFRIELLCHHWWNLAFGIRYTSCHILHTPLQLPQCWDLLKQDMNTCTNSTETSKLKVCLELHLLFKCVCACVCVRACARLWLCACDGRTRDCLTVFFKSNFFVRIKCEILHQLCLGCCLFSPRFLTNNSADAQSQIEAVLLNPN